MPETMAIPPYRLIPLRPVSACRSLEVAARRAEVTLEVMAHRNAAMEKLISVVEPMATPPTMGMSVSHTFQEYLRPKKSDSSTTAIAGSPALTTCMNDTEPNL